MFMDDFLEKYFDEINWGYSCYNFFPSPEFVERHQDKFILMDICRFGNLKTIRKHLPKNNYEWDAISRNASLDVSFIEELNWNGFLKNILNVLV